MGTDSFSRNEVFIKRGDPLPFARATVRVCLPTAIERLSKRHWREFHDHDPVLYQQYLQHAVCIQPFDGERAVGYLFMYVIPQSYEPGFMGMVDLYYLEPEYRGEGVGSLMFELAEQTAKQAGANKMVASYNLAKRHSEFFKSLGYTETHVIVSKGI